MKILLALESFFPTHTAGTEVYVYNLAKNLQKNGFDVDVIIPSTKGETEEYSYKNLTIYRYPVSETASAAEMNGIVPPKGLSEFIRLLDVIKPDIYHLHSFGRAQNSWHLKAASSKNIKTVFTAHLGGTFCARGDLLYMGVKKCDGTIKLFKCTKCFASYRGVITPLNSLIALASVKIIPLLRVNRFFPALNHIHYKQMELNRLLNNADCVIAIAKWISRAFRNNGIPASKLIKQGINSDFITPNHKEHRKNNELRILFIGRIAFDKGLHLLLDAIKEIANPKLHLTIIGIKDKEDYYRQIKNKAELLANVILKENLSQKQVADHLEKADILCLPSISNEVAPLVILEAFAKGVPVLGSDYPAIAEMVKHNCDGLLFNNRSMESLQQQLKRLLDEADLLQQLSFNVNVPRTFQDVAKDHIQIYNELI